MGITQYKRKGKCKMELLVEKRYLKIPVRFDGEPRRFTVSENGAPVYEFDAA